MTGFIEVTLIGTSQRKLTVNTAHIVSFEEQNSGSIIMLTPVGNGNYFTLMVIETYDSIVEKIKRVSL